MKKIVVFGSSNMDMVVSVEQMPKKGETIKSLAFDMIPGGKGANQACACGKLGGCCVFLSVVGADGNGTRLLQSLKSSGVDTGHMLVSKNAPTGMALITVDVTGENSIVVVPGANKECDFDYYCRVKSEIESSDIVLAQLETPESAVYKLLSDAHESGKTTILNPAPAPTDLPDDLYASIDFMTPNETELEILTGCPTDTLERISIAARRLIEKGAGNVIVTLGKMGALHIGRNVEELYPAFETTVIDTTAAGDTFNAALAVGLAEGMSISNAIKFGNAAAALSVSRKGTQSSIPDREETDKFVFSGK